jgi:hypothetical protein
MPHMFKVWQKLTPFGGKLIGGSVEALLAKANNQQVSVLPIVICFVAAAATLPNSAESIILSAGGAESIYALSTR